jgi:glucose/mannose-6-phosphate isomerase
LDDAAFVARHDPKNLYELTLGFPNQCRQALEISHAVPLSDDLKGQTNLIVAGMGGSAAGGDFLAAICAESATIPCVVSRDYSVPNHCGSKSLVFACSYSGDTEETLAATEDALTRGAMVIAVTSGGALGDLVARKGYPVIRIPGGQPPRTALGFLFVPLVEACVRLGYLPSQRFDIAFQHLDACTADYRVEREFERNLAKGIADRMVGAVPLICGNGTWQGAVANRWKSQLNENAKVMAFASAIPEHNHNEIIGWQTADSQNVLNWITVFLEGGAQTAKMLKRREVTEQLIREKSECYSVLARGESRLSEILSLSYVGDFVSLYLAALNGVDPESIDAIKTLKRELAQVS